MNKSIDVDVSKSFKEFRQTDIGRNYRTSETNSSQISILNQTIDDLIEIHDFIDMKRKESFEQMKKLIDFAREKQVRRFFSLLFAHRSQLDFRIKFVKQ